MRWQRQHCLRRGQHFPATGDFRGRVRRGYAGLLLIAGFCCTALIATPAAAQTGRGDVLSPTYYRALAAYQGGDYIGAVKEFEDAGKGAIRSGAGVGETRWIDSICYHSMAGEACYQTGQLKQSLAHFGSALQLYLQYSDWMQQVQFPPQVGQRIVAAGPVPWGRSQRQFRLGQIAEKFNISRGRTNVINAGDRTLLQPGEMLMSMHASELVRTTALAIRRRRELLGPVAPHDRLLQEVVARLAGRPGQNGSLSEAWIDLQLGVGYAATGRTEQAVTALTRSLVVGGDFDHPLTGMAMLELGRLHAEKGEFATAANWFAEASYSGYYFMQPDVIEEALRLGAVVHMLSGAKGIYPPLAPAAEWANSKRLRTVQATALIYAAENATIIGDSRQATAALGQVGRALNRKDLGVTLAGARFNYVTAMVAYQRRQPKAAEPALAAALNWQRKGGSLKLFQMGMVDQFYRDGIIRDREAVELFGKALDEPSARDWRTEPMEAITMLLSPQEALLDRWLEAAMAHEDWKSALEVSDRIRRRRFYSTLPLGGRLMSLRWILEGPEAALPEGALLQRNDLLNRLPSYRDQVRQADALQTELQALPPMPDDRTQATQQLKLLLDLGRVYETQDAMLLDIALRREPAALVFPPQRPLDDVQKRLRPGQAILVFQATGRAIYGFLITNSRNGAWKIQSPENVRKRLVAMLRAMGHFDQNREVDSTLLADPTWRGEAAALLNEIMQGSKIDLGQGIQELVIVPDDFLWYVPFEALQIGPPNKTQSLLTRMRVRYSPTIGLAVPDGRNRRQAGTTGVVMGRIFPHESEELSAGALDRLKRALPQTAPITKLPAAQSSLLARRFDTLLVLDDLGGADEQGAYQLAPLRHDRGRPGSRLEDWLKLPPGGPEVVALPGFHTPTENGLKKSSRNVRAGDELFLTTCALMSTGARTVLISRWRTGGRACNDLAVEFLQELPNTSAADAWQRAVEVVRQAPLDLTLEPRAKVVKETDSIKGEHPFFWAGYMIVDSGTDPRIKGPQNAKPPAGVPGGAAPKAVPPAQAPPPAFPAPAAVK